MAVSCCHIVQMTFHDIIFITPLQSVVTFCVVVISGEIAYKYSKYSPRTPQSISQLERYEEEKNNNVKR